MKKKLLYSAIVLTLVLVAVLVIFLLPDRTKLDIRMYGAEVTGDGTVIYSENFTLKGAIIHRDAEWDLLTLEPVVFSGEDGLTIDGQHRTMLQDLTSDRYYHTAWLTFLDSKSRHEQVRFGLSKDLTTCIFIVGGSRCFVGSTDENFDPSEILTYFSELF